MTPRKIAHRIKSLILLVRMKRLTHDTRRLTAAMLDDRNSGNFGRTLQLYSRSLKLANRQMRLMYDMHEAQVACCGFYQRSAHA